MRCAAHSAQLLCSANCMQAFAMNQQCVISWSGTHIAFSYYGGAYTRAARNTPANYIAEANSTRNLWSWNDRACSEKIAYICEFKGERGSGCWRAALSESTLAGTLPPNMLICPLPPNMLCYSMLCYATPRLQHRVV